MNPSISRTRTIRAVFSFGLVLFATRAFAADVPSVAGVWEYKDPVVANSITFTLNADGTGKVDDEAVRYTVVGDKINIVTGGDTIAYTFKITGDTLKLTMPGGAGDNSIAFARVKAGGGGDRPNPFDIAGKLAGGDAQPVAPGGLPVRT